MRLIEFKLHDHRRLALKFAQTVVASGCNAFVPLRWASMADLCHKERHNFGHTDLCSPLHLLLRGWNTKVLQDSKGTERRMTPPGLEQRYGSRGCFKLHR